MALCVSGLRGIVGGRGTAAIRRDVRQNAKRLLTSPHTTGQAACCTGFQA
ncbi:hypothetical protein KCP77_09860 [Salmonella enterica subsp. enterica]|nr:hypothetical protein KCP77_09860 [Salmonella enterica subsp. enterica]